MKITITLPHMRKTAFFEIYIFASTMTLQFLFDFRGQRCLLLFNGVLFALKIPTESILLCMVYHVALMLENVESLEAGEAG